MMADVKSTIDIHPGNELELHGWSGCRADKESKYYVFQYGNLHDITFYTTSELLGFIREAKRLLTKAGVTETDL